MSFILNLDCSSAIAFVSISKDGELLALKKSIVQKEHAAFIHKGIEDMLKELKLKTQDLVAVAVADGPGSYTGLRVAMATAKGLAYSLDIPIICYHNFLALAAASKQFAGEKAGIHIPVIDARRMEVFTATYDRDLNEIETGKSLVLTENSFIENLNHSPVFFSGDAIEKLRKIVQHTNAHFIEVSEVEYFAAQITRNLYFEKKFDNLYYSEPYYIKPFYNG